MITSRVNPKVKEWLKLSYKKERLAKNQFLIEGQHLVEEALRHNRLVSLIKSEHYHGDLSFKDEVIVSEPVAQKLSSTNSKSTIFGISRIVEPSDLGTRWLFLNGVQDPGNVGTLIRSAASFGYDSIFFDSQTADVYSEKVVRSSQGAIFYLNLVEISFVDMIELCKQQDITRVGTYLLPQISQEMPTGPHCLFLGNEGAGLDEKYLSEMNCNVLVEVQQFESLNVAIAGSILMHQSQKKR